MTVEASSSKCANPPRLNRPRSSSSGPPGPCMTPSTETCAVVVSFMVAFPFSLGFCCRSIRPDRGADLTGRSRVRPADPFRTLPEHGQQDAHQRSSILKLLTVRRARSVRKAPEHRDETDEEQRDTDGQHEEERPQVTEGRRHLRQDLLQQLGDSFSRLSAVSCDGATKTSLPRSSRNHLRRRSRFCSSSSSSAVVNLPIRISSLISASNLTHSVRNSVHSPSRASV